MPLGQRGSTCVSAALAHQGHLVWFGALPRMSVT
jgi:hypothetical protein